jgi:hypothetical protein
MRKASQRVKVVKKQASVRAAEKKAREAEIAADKIFNARQKYEKLIARVDELNELSWGGFTLVTDPGAGEDEEGLFDPIELALVPTLQLYHGRIALEQAQEVLAAMIEQNQQALEARPD